MIKLTLYCLTNGENEYYCGKAVNFPRRLYEHRIGRGSDATRTWSTVEVYYTTEAEIAQARDGYFLELGFTEQMRRQLPGMMVYGPGDHKKQGYISKKRKRNEGSTFSF